MLSEVRDQYVDISVAAYGRTPERNTLVDFTPGIGLSSIILLIRRPSKHDMSFRYFFLGKYNYFSFDIFLINHPLLIHNRIYTIFMVNTGLDLHGFADIVWSNIISFEELWH